jgi:decaprenylphospho-beta-D-erythro-pentofuranosid-2-ulose 2-reductase
MKNVLFLGADSDVALACIPVFANNGCNLILAAKTFTDGLKIKVNEFEKQIKIFYVKFDALDYNNHKNFYTNLEIKPTVVVSFFGFLGNNDQAFIDFNLAREIISINFLGNVSILNCIAKDFQLNKSGKIICLTSVAGIRGRASNFIYGSSKAGLIAYLSGLRAFLVTSNVHVVTIIPGYIKTKMLTFTTPRFLTASPTQVAQTIFKSVNSKRNVRYVLPIWKWIMLFISIIPEFVFKKLKL